MKDERIEWLSNLTSKTIKQSDMIYGSGVGMFVSLVVYMLSSSWWASIFSVCILNAFLFEKKYVAGALFGLVGGIIGMNCVSLMGSEFSLVILGIFIGLIIVVGEIFFFLDKKKPKKKDNKFSFTAKRKGLALMWSTLVTTQIAGLYFNIKKGIPWIFTHQEMILKNVGYIGIIVGAIGLLICLGWGYIKLNSLKYK